MINALRRKPHLSHITLDEALELVGRIGPRVAYLTHISHDMGRYADVAPSLPGNVFLAVDDQKIEIPDGQ